MLNLVRNSRSVFLFRDFSILSRSNPHPLPDSFKSSFSHRYIVSSSKLLSVSTNAFYAVLDDLMRGKHKSKKNKKKTANYVTKKAKVLLSWAKYFPTFNKFVISAMSRSNASCSTTPQKFDETVTVTSMDSDDDVVILDMPERDDVQVLYDSHQQNDQRRYFLKNEEDFQSQRTLSAAEIKEAAKQGKEKYEEIRQEQFTKFGEEIFANEAAPKLSREGFVFRVLSWNILSQKLMEQHRYLYSNSLNVSLDWEYRKTQILSEIKDSNADILTLQEVEEQSFHAISELKNLGYTGIFKKRTNDKIDGCAIYYRPDKLTLKEHAFVEFYQPGVRLLDRDNIGIVARFEPKDSEGNEFIVATTHLLYNPKRHDIKLVQMQLLLAEVERLAFSGALRQGDKLIPMYHPCILTGDMNLSPQSGVYNLITEGKLQYEQLSSRNLSTLDSPNSFHTLPRVLLPPYLGITDNCQHEKLISQRTFMRQSIEEESRLVSLYNSERRSDRYRRSEEPNWRDSDDRNLNRTDSQSKYGTGILSHNLKFKSVYPHLKNGVPEVTTHQDWWITVDYIFYSPVIQQEQESSLRLVSFKGLPSANEAADYLKTIPNLFCGSDHLPLVSTFFLAKS